MTRPPEYIVHEVDEKDVTVDWFFTRGLSGRKIRQFVLMLIGWFFAILPIVITTSALLYRHRRGGWWKYREGFYMWDRFWLMMEILLVVFVIGFLALYVLHRSSSRKRDRRRTYDAARLTRRLELAAYMYDGRYGPEDLRLARKNVVIEPYSDVETYELRDLYREYGVAG